MALTDAQQKAITARGNVLVVAGAGTGKTRTLVERCLACLLHDSPPANIDELLVVTFTEAAAAEMRQRIREELQKRGRANPSDARLQEQLALFDTASIGTLHSFCYQLVRQHFYELKLDPQLAILAEEEGPLLAQEILERVFESHYNGKGVEADAVRELIMGQTRGSDLPVRRLVLRLHYYSQTLPDPKVWFDAQSAGFESGQPHKWGEWFCQAVRELREGWVGRLRQAAGNPVAICCADALADLPASPSRVQCAEALTRAADSVQHCVRGKKKYWVDPWDAFFEQVRFLRSLARGGEQDPLVEDWNAVRGQMATLLNLAREFGVAFKDAKRDLGVVDFSDLEQYALELLWDQVRNKPTAVAEHWRKKLKFVFVDEYQDINAAQDKIIECLSRDGAGANRFLVGDIKQSIYRFRLADPYIFQDYVKSWDKERGKVIPLVDNFRSREGILAFVNALFPQVMRSELGGVAYDELAALRFGGETERLQLSLKAAKGPAVELHLRLRNSAEDFTPPEDDTGDAFARQVLDLEEADKEARMVGLRLKELVESGHKVWDDALEEFRPAQWSDTAVLLRAPAGKSQRYAREFAKLGIPLAVARSEFYRSLEISDMLSILQLLDNPLQDVPLLAVLRSPLVGLSLEELGQIRLAAKGRFWNSLSRWHEGGAGEHKSVGDDTRAKVATFLGRFRRWRRMAREVSLSRCLDTLLSETGYAPWLLTQARGEPRHANLQRFLALAQKFDRFQRQSLFRFLRFIEAQQEAETEPEVGSSVERDAVRLMSIHQSKGLQFPIVVVADLAKKFNTDDLSGDIILDEQYGLCPRVQVAGTSIRYPSLPHWLAPQRQLRELLGEELRLLYVALTRARDHLLLVGSLSIKQVQRLRGPQEEDLDPANAGSYWDWLAQWLGRTFDDAARAENQGLNEYLAWTLREDAELVAAPAGAIEVKAETGEAEVLAHKAEQLSSWRYRYEGAARVPAKSSVTSLRRRAAARLEPGAFAPFVGGTHLALRGRKPAGGGGQKEENASSAKVGNAHHAFLEWVSLDKVVSAAMLRAEAERLKAAGALAPEDVCLLDFEALAAFWASELGQYVRAHGANVRRELPFTARLSASEVASFTGEQTEPGLEGEFVVIQGVADLVVLLPDELRVVDFKTDSVRSEDLGEKAKFYRPQLRIYACALSRIYRRPVSECWLYFLNGRRAVRVE